MKNLKEIKIPIFPVRLYVKISEPNDPHILAQTDFNENGWVYVVLPSTSSPATIVHESVHVVQYIQKFVETTFDMETFAYLTEHIFDKLCKCSGDGKIHSK